HNLVGLPFVYAVWAGRPGVVSIEDVALLQESLQLGLQRRAEIGRAWALDNGVDPSVGENYLLENIRHRLGSDEIWRHGLSGTKLPGWASGQARARVPVRCSGGAAFAAAIGAVPGSPADRRCCGR